MMKRSTVLRTIKLGHTLIWAFFAACILAIPCFAHAGNFRAATVLIIVVAFEVVVLAFNDWSCPLTGMAAQQTRERRPNFDIYLPEWLAKYNKEIFGPLYIAGVMYTLILWL